jgi:hypothetical protein
MEIGKLGIPIVLLSAIWAALDVILKSIEMINQYRDKAADPKFVAERMHIFWSDWLWLWLGACWFLLLFTVVVAFIPTFIPSSMEVPVYQRRLCWLAATLPGFALIGMLIGGILDIPVFFR